MRCKEVHDGALKLIPAFQIYNGFQQGSDGTRLCRKGYEDCIVFRPSKCLLPPARWNNVSDLEDLQEAPTWLAETLSGFRWRRGEVLELARANAYWGPKPQWERMRLLLRAKDATRVSALLAGEVDLIEQVPTASLAMLERRDDVTVVKASTSRLIFLGLDMQRAQTPHFSDAGGQPLVPKPLRDKRVREAISIAIDRQALATQMMDGSAMPAGQLMPPGHPGTSPALPPDPNDPARARALLREAGIPEGARLVLHGPNDRYLNDKMVLVAIAAMLRRVGLAVEPVMAPFSVHRAPINRGDASFALTGWATETGDASLALRALLGATGRPTGWWPTQLARLCLRGFRGNARCRSART